MKKPTNFSRTIENDLEKQGLTVNRKQIQRIMRLMGIEAIYPKQNICKQHPDHQISPYMLRGMDINRLDKVWAADITDIPLRHGNMYV